jgi:FkbM family methyltransferase
MDLSGAFLDLVVGRVSPRLRARAAWWLADRAGDFAPAVVEQLVRPGDVCLDIGASWGLFTHRLAEIAGPAGAVHAFEPNPVNHRSLERIRGGRPGVTIHRCALSGAAQTAALRVPRRRGASVHAMGSLSVPESRSGLFAKSVRVQTQRLDDVLGSAVADVCFVKCDVEGHEQAMLDGARRLLTEARPAVLIEIEQRHREAPVEDTFDRFTETGYEGYALGPGRLIPLAEFDVERDQLALLSEGELEPAPPPGYLNDFLFVQPGTDLGRLSPVPVDPG